LFACLVFFFFFQAEDGIRDDLVTGVQTCALPISINTSSIQLIPANQIAMLAAAGSVRPTAIIGTALVATTVSTVVGIVSVKLLRSEERRVGKECRSRWAAYREKKKRRIGHAPNTS